MLTTFQLWNRYEQWSHVKNDMNQSRWNTYSTHFEYKRNLKIVFYNVIRICVFIIQMQIWSIFEILLFRLCWFHAVRFIWTISTRILHFRKRISHFDMRTLHFDTRILLSQRRVRNCLRRLFDSRLSSSIKIRFRHTKWIILLKILNHFNSSCYCSKYLQRQSLNWV